MQKVLENGTWLVNEVPLFVREWMSGLFREKIEPNKFLYELAFVAFHWNFGMRRV